MGILAFMVVWFIGCVIFDAWLGFATPWQLMAGAALGVFAQVAQELVNA
jgi:hypothetical protein